jgi:hypothetical protein
MLKRKLFYRSTILLHWGKKNKKKTIAETNSTERDKKRSRNNRNEER